MNINLTLIAQSIAFFVFAYICWRFIWPVIIAAMEERQQRIEKGLTDAEMAKKALADSEESASQQIEQARGKADEIVRKARELAANIEQQGRDQGRKESERVLQEGRQEIERLLQSSRQDLRADVAGLVFDGVEKIVGKSVDRQLHDKLVKELIQQL